MDEFRDDIDGMDVFETSPPRRKIRFFFKLVTAALAIAIGGVFLGFGISAGNIVMQRLMPTPIESVETAPHAPGFNTVASEPTIIAINPQTPDFTSVIADVKDAVVSISVTTTVRGGSARIAEQQGAGSGFIFAQDDNYVFIATNHHVIANATTITISLDDNESVVAHLVGSEPDYDLAVLAVTIEALEEKGVPFTVAELGCSDTMRMGDSVVAIGNAMGAGQTATKGIISAVNLEITIRNQSGNANLVLDVLQTDAAVNQGNSGGPLINQNGEVIGIVTAKLFGHGIEGMGYVLPINDVRQLLEDIMEFGPGRRAWIGVLYDPITEPIRNMFNLPSLGLMITIVASDSPAYHAGIMPRDILVSFEGHILLSHEDYAAAISNFRPGDEVTIGLYRGSEHIYVSVVLGSITR